MEGLRKGCTLDGWDTVGWGRGRRAGEGQAGWGRGRGGAGGLGEGQVGRPPGPERVLAGCGQCHSWKRGVQLLPPWGGHWKARVWGGVWGWRPAMSTVPSGWCLSPPLTGVGALLQAGVPPPPPSHSPQALRTGGPSQASSPRPSPTGSLGSGKGLLSLGGSPGSATPGAERGPTPPSAGQLSALSSGTTQRPSLPKAGVSWGKAGQQRGILFPPPPAIFTGEAKAEPGLSVQGHLLGTQLGSASFMHLMLPRSRLPAPLLHANFKMRRRLGGLGPRLRSWWALRDRAAGPREAGRRGSAGRPAPPAGRYRPCVRGPRSGLPESRAPRGSEPLPRGAGKGRGRRRRGPRPPAGLPRTPSCRLRYHEQPGDPSARRALGHKARPPPPGARDSPFPPQRDGRAAPRGTRRSGAPSRGSARFGSRAAPAPRAGPETPGSPRPPLTRSRPRARPHGTELPNPLRPGPCRSPSPPPPTPAA